MRLFAIWLGRVVANTIVGGFTFAVIALFCGMIVGGLAGVLVGFDGGTYGALIGGGVGLSSGVVGALIYAVASASTQSATILQPYLNLRGRVGWGQVFGTGSAYFCYLIFVLSRTQLKGAVSSEVALNDAGIFMFVAPAMMIVGAIAGAVFKRD